MHRRLDVLAFITIFSVGSFATSVQAVLINIVLTEVDVIYDGTVGGAFVGGALFDQVDLVGGSGDPNFADPVSTASFTLNGGPPPASGGNNTIFSTDDPMWQDFRVEEVGAGIPFGTLLLGAGSNGDNFGLHWFSGSGLELSLNVDNVDIYTGGIFFFTGEAESLVAQNLPFDLKLDPNSPITFSYNSQIPDYVLSGSTVTQANGRGTLTITGTAIPEPGACPFLGVVSALMIFVARRRTKAVP